MFKLVYHALTIMHLKKTILPLVKHLLLWHSLRWNRKSFQQWQKRPNKSHSKSSFSRSQIYVYFWMSTGRVSRTGSTYDSSKQSTIVFSTIVSGLNDSIVSKSVKCTLRSDFRLKLFRIEQYDIAICKRTCWNISPTYCKHAPDAV